MQVDKITQLDLSLFSTDENLSIFHLLNYTTTSRGKDYLHYILNNPLSTLAEIEDAQNTIQQLQLLLPRWKHTINNGTLMVIEKFYETPLTIHSNEPT
ncbi:MAG: DNA mismatch repair protein MutS, partial [Chitinophagaceae bacterium]|nr:DNA mismatch repair protein MutS [Chitinophagaceae bacterium]